MCGVTDKMYIKLQKGIIYRKLHVKFGVSSFYNSLDLCVHTDSEQRQYIKMIDTDCYHAYKVCPLGFTFF